MIKNPKINKVNIYLRDGREILRKDIPHNSLGENDRVICYFDEDESLHVIPLDLVKHIAFYYENSNESPL
jgi:hypothetical protein